ncbi:MAG: signal transduction histidine kinase [Maribacter sp.]|jgi:signal transduction histidine kinase
MKETSFQDTLNLKLQEYNERSAFATSIICITFFFILMIMDYLRWKNGVFQRDYSYLILVYIHLLMALFFIPLLNAKFKFISLKPKASLGTNALICLSIVYISIIPFSFINAYARGEMIAFAICICIINLFFETDIKNKLYINIGLFIIITILNLIKPESFLVHLLRIIEALAIISFTYILARNRYSNRVETHDKEIQLQDKNKLLIEQNKLIEEKNKDLTSFAYATSHHLKEPLRMVSSFIKLLDKSLDGKIDGNDKECMKFINVGVGNMEQMLDGLLEYASLEKEIKETEPIELNKIFSEVSNNLKFLISQSKANIKIKDNLPQIKMSKILAIQLFQHLIANAIKFRKKEETPIIAIDFIKTNENITISISDNGIGIPNNELENIFGIFNRLHSKNEIAGNGIGLASCKKIIEKMQGKIWVESEYGVGSIFFVSFSR